MQIGVVIPQTEIGADPAAIREYARTVESLGYRHLVAFDHVLGADPSHRPGWMGYTHKHQFHEPLVLFGYLAALTQLELVTAVIILPQRQAVLVAKQAAEVDVLSGGKLRLGVGIGWNLVEFEALVVNRPNLRTQMLGRRPLVRTLGPKTMGRMLDTISICPPHFTIMKRFQ
jgi:alkanesulfonate monooxygenase SsuD/methylene tetrahydromethanopterin reductase-like flavin-dependent oxidoreductase (luciferase family)